MRRVIARLNREGELLTDHREVRPRQIFGRYENLSVSQLRGACFQPNKLDWFFHLRQKAALRLQ